jgi:hypothetical protein
LSKRFTGKNGIPIMKKSLSHKSLQAINNTAIYKFEINDKTINEP